MPKKFAQGKFVPKNPEKYIGVGDINARSSWEFTMMRFLDENENVIYWASESIRIPYMNPFTRKQTIYVPDFFIVYVDKHGKQHSELIEVKPLNQTVQEMANKSKHNKAHWILNQAKWNAAQEFCKKRQIKFRVITENDIYLQMPKQKGRKR